jgi:hypothetical protein
MPEVTQFKPSFRVVVYIITSKSDIGCLARDKQSTAPDFFWKQIQVPGTTTKQ